VIAVLGKIEVAERQARRMAAFEDATATPA
jgi:hypothetical protein